ncbi:hypothetical protein GCM10009863_05600 [Streptomyces axinellae]|uniref:Uncharacterized protein n=1 Tax=Streptomyces axinellae TaxID=552788 RepID=A0ABN3PTH8_9ACTN
MSGPPTTADRPYPSYGQRRGIREPEHPDRGGLLWPSRRIAAVQPHRVRDPHAAYTVRHVHSASRMRASRMRASRMRASRMRAPAHIRTYGDSAAGRITGTVEVYGAEPGAP